jgi:hypothetical protein
MLHAPSQVRAEHPGEVNHTAKVSFQAGDDLEGLAANFCRGHAISNPSEAARGIVQQVGEGGGGGGLRRARYCGRLGFAKGAIVTRGTSSLLRALPAAAFCPRALLCKMEELIDAPRATARALALRPPPHAVPSCASGGEKEHAAGAQLLPRGPFAARLRAFYEK